MKDAAKVHWWALLLPMLAVLIWSLNITVTRYVADYISPVSISFYRWLVAFLVLTPFILPQVWKQRMLVRRHLGQLAVLSAFGMVLYQGLAYSAAHYTTATNMGIINAFIPVFTIFVSMFILKDIPNKFAVIGSVIVCHESGTSCQLIAKWWALGRCHHGGCGVFLCILWGVFKEIAVTESVIDQSICANRFCSDLSPALYCVVGTRSD